MFLIFRLVDGPGIWNNNCKNPDADISLLEVLTNLKGAADSGPQQPPVGYAVIGWHVDDGGCGES